MTNRLFLLTGIGAVVFFLLPLRKNLLMAEVADQDPGLRNVDLRRQLSAVYTRELGVREATGLNDGDRVEQYLAYTQLGKGYDWCAAFISWVYGQVGRPKPRSPWSPALFPQSRVIWQNGVVLSRNPQQGDVFGIWNKKLQRIAHVGFIDAEQDHYFITVEGNSNNAVRRLRRPGRSLYRIADWTLD